MIKEEQVCRICGGDLRVIVNFGEIYPSGFVTSQEGLTKAPLVLAICNKCSLVQLKHTVNLDLMYRQYWYSSSLNRSMVDSLKDVADSILELGNVKESDVILDIGCNDGIMFKFFPKETIKVGFDPALNLQEKAKENCDYFINEYFDANLYPSELPKAKVITSIAMFYDLPDPNTFIENVKEVMADDGVWVIQLTDLLSMLQVNAFDNVCHEHLEYYSLAVLYNLMLSHDLEIFDVHYNKVNGGSIRVYIHRKTDKEPASRVAYYCMTQEMNYMKQWDNPIEAMLLRVKTYENLLKRELNSLKEYGEQAFILGASTKGNTLLQIWGFTKEDFPYALEVNPDKFGLKTVGSDIPIVSEQHGLDLNPKALVVLPWHFIDTMRYSFKDYMDKGGYLIAPLPVLTTYQRSDGKEWMLQQKVSVNW